jgi:hypothetical protein
MTEWEYHIEVIPVTTKTVDIEMALTALGICNWELVAAQGDRYYFKRVR